MHRTLNCFTFKRVMCTTPSNSFKPKYYDVGVNITDSMFSGNYHGRKHHRDDSIDVLQKAYRHHVERILLTGSSLSESRKTLQILRSLQETTEIPKLYSTVGVHPCTVTEFESNDYTVQSHLDELENLINNNLDVIKAFGEIGLDYDRLHYTPIDKQKLYFQLQLKLASKFDLPLFLHMRAACDDFISILSPFLTNNLLKNKNLLIHSFTGTIDELDKLLNFQKSVPNYNLYFSINGAGLRENETLEMIPHIPLNRLMIETDSPWCEIKKTHPSWEYLSKSPNKFYPDDNENYNLITQQPQIKQLIENSKLNKKNKNNTNIQFHDFLPIPVVKSEKFDNFQFSQLFNDSPLIKSRNEPCLIGLVAMVISKITKTDPQVLIDTCYKNSVEVFS